MSVAELHSYAIVNDGEKYLIELVVLTQDGSVVNVHLDPREALAQCSGISDLSYRAVRLNEEAKELDEKRKQAHGTH